MSVPWSGSCTGPFWRFCHYSCSAAAVQTAPAFHFCCHQRHLVCSPSSSSLVGEPDLGYGHNATVLGAPLVSAGLGWLVALSGQGTLRLPGTSVLVAHA